MSFSNYKLQDPILKALQDSGYDNPTEIQERSLNVILEGKDIIASAKTGSGKTAAFLIPSISNMLKVGSEKKGPKILILTPTRELADQILSQAEKYTKHCKNLKSVCVVGGVPYFKQEKKLSKRYDILIATPGRLIDYLKKGKISFSEIQTVVLDEADRMLDMGFSESVEEILEKTPQKKQTLLFSATLEEDILRLSGKFLQNPQKILVHKAQDKNENITTRLHYVDNLSHKNELLDHILNAEDINQAIIFTSTKRHCDELCDELTDKRFFANALHGDMNQRQRTRTLKKLKESKIQILVATDVAARGIDIATITHVINFDLPRDPEDFVHRIGRTGRAGRKGVAISFAGPKDLPLVPRIEKFTEQTLEVVEIKGLEPKLKPKAEKKDPPKSRRGRLRNRRSGNNSRDSKRGSKTNSRSEKKNFSDKKSPKNFRKNKDQNKDEAKAYSKGKRNSKRVNKNRSDERSFKGSAKKPNGISSKKRRSTKQEMTQKKGFTKRSNGNRKTKKMR